MMLHLFLCLAVSFTPAAAGEGFLGGPSAAKASELARDEAFRQALGAVMGCGSDSERSASFARIEQVLLPMWRSLPKNTDGRVEWRMLRYLAHRYFMKTSSLLIRGFEPSRRVNESDLGAAEILQKQAPSLVQTVLGSGDQSKGFSLEDAVAMVATLEQLILDSETKLLEMAFKQQRHPVTSILDHDEFFQTVESYLVHWMVEGHAPTARAMLRNRTLLSEGLPNWSSLEHFAEGVARSVEFTRLQASVSGHGRVAMTGKFSFDEAHEAVGAITKGFASFWEAQCQDIKSSLVELDKANTGRVSLKAFYAANADGEWRFGESEAYLRELGALDETSVWKGPQVIIPNYLHGASNCIVNAEHYMVCCVNECEEILHEIEDTVQAPVAEPGQILELVRSMTTSLDDQPLKISSDLIQQLDRLAETHGGKVPVHGRLFAQWLHYVFPRECPFPHKAGVTSTASISEFGQSSLASEEEVRHHASKRNVSSEQMHRVEEEQALSQWSEEEELIVDYSLHLSAPWDTSGRLAAGGMALGGAIIALFVLSGVQKLQGSKVGGNRGIGSLSTESGKSHFV